MVTDLPTHGMRVPRSTIVKIQQQDTVSTSTSPKPRLVTGYTYSSSGSFQSQRASSPPLPPPPPPQPQVRTPEPSPSSSLTRAKRVITSSAVVNSSRRENKLFELSGRQQFALSGGLVSDLNGMRNGDKANDRRNNTFRKKDKDCKEKHKNKESDHVCNSRKSRCIFSSQVYLMFHISITVCLIGYKEYEKSSNNLISYELTILIYFVYLLTLSIIFLLLLRCFNYDSNDIGIKEIPSENTAILIGATSLGVIQLIQIGLEIAQCIENELVVFPVLHFIFTLFLMHFLLTQVIQDKNLGLTNIALSHILSTQISLWLINLDSSFEACHFNIDHQNLTSITSNLTTKNMFLPASITNLIVPIIHHFKLLTCFILVTIWFTNNQSKIHFIRAKLSDEEAMRAAFLSSKHSSIKGFFIGLLVLSTAIIILLLEDDLLKIITHTSIEGISGIVAIIGLVIRRKKKYLNYKYQINLLDYHFIIYVTSLAAYISGLTNILLNLKTKNMNIGAIFDGLILIAQITSQTFLMRLQGRKFVNMSQVSALLVLSNLSLWIIEISAIAHNAVNFSAILSLFVSLNRFYSSLVFIQFWKTKSY